MLPPLEYNLNQKARVACSPCSARDTAGVSVQSFVRPGHCSRRSCFWEEIGFIATADHHYINLGCKVSYGPLQGQNVAQSSQRS